MSNEQKKCPNCGGTEVKVYQYSETLQTFDLATGEWNNESFDGGSDYLLKALCAECETDLLHLVPGQTLAEEPMVHQLLKACESLLKQAEDMAEVCLYESQSSPCHYEAIEQAQVAIREATGARLAAQQLREPRHGNGGVASLPAEEARGVLDELVVALGYCIGFITGKHSTTEADKAEVLECAHEAIKGVTS